MEGTWVYRKCCGLDSQGTWEGRSAWVAGPSYTTPVLWRLPTVLIPSGSLAAGFRGWVLGNHGEVEGRQEDPVVAMVRWGELGLSARHRVAGHRS